MTAAMPADIKVGHQFWPGLVSPGPRYAVPPLCFAKASKMSEKPSWGPPPAHEVRESSDPIRSIQCRSLACC
jgi:hypothetical protein